MGRGRSSSPKAKRGVPEKKAPAKTASKPTSSNASTPAPAAPKSTQTMANSQHPTASHPTSTPAHTTPQPVQTSGGGRSLMGEIAANAASTAAGVVAAHAVMGALGMGGHGSSSSSDEKPQSVAAAPQQQFQPVQSEPTVCRNQYQTFMNCLETNSNNISACQWALDMFNQCKGMSTNSSEKFL